MKYWQAIRDAIRPANVPSTRPPKRSRRKSEATASPVTASIEDRCETSSTVPQRVPGAAKGPNLAQRLIHALRHPTLAPNDSSTKPRGAVRKLFDTLRGTVRSVHDVLRPATRPTNTRPQTTHRSVQKLVDALRPRAAARKARTASANKTPAPAATRVPPAPAPAPEPLVPIYRLRPTQLFDFQGFPLSSEAAKSQDRVMIPSNKSMGASILPLSEATAQGQQNYHALKHSFLVEAQARGLDTQRLAFNDGEHTIDLGYSAYELAVFFPHTMQTFMPKVARKPASLAMEVPLLMEDLTDQFSQKNLGTKKTRETQIGELLAARKQPPRKNVDLHSATADGLFKQFFAQHDGVVVGESHIDAAPRQWMIQGMPTLRAQGVTTLYLEHVMGSMQKHVLDAYHRAPPHSPMPRELSLALRAIDRNLGGHVAVPESASLTALVRAAQANGIRVVAFESDASYAASPQGPASSSTPRMRMMNHLALNKIQEQKSGKWIALVGSMHMNTIHENNGFGMKGQTTPGLAELTGAAAVAVYDAKPGDPGSLQRGYQANESNEDNVKTRFDHFLALPQQTTGQTHVEIAKQTMLNPLS